MKFARLLKPLRSGYPWLWPRFASTLIGDN
jgi:hypothetical protein